MTASPLSQSEEQISREVQELLRGMIQPLKVWWPILNNPPHPHLEYMKDIAFVLLLPCLRETLTQHKNRFVRLKKEAEKSGRVSIVQSLIAFEEISKFPKIVFEPLNENEQILLSLTRDRIVHGYLGGTASSDDRNVKIVFGEIVKTVPVSKARIKQVIGLEDKVTSKDLRPIRLRVMPQILKYAKNTLRFEQIFNEFGTLAKFFEKNMILYFGDQKTDQW